MGDIKDKFLKAPGLLEVICTEENSLGVLFGDFE